MKNVRSRMWCGLGLWTLLFCVCAAQAQAQVTVDRMVATVNSGSPHDLITYSDLLWQMALEPNTPLQNPSSESLNRALQTVVDQRLILQEAERLPSISPSDKEIADAITELISRFPSSAEFYQRLNSVGLSSDQLREIVRQRVAIEKYLDFRFRSFTVVTPEEVANYYKDAYVPRFRQRFPGRIVPKLEEVRDELEKTLTDSKIASDIDSFLDVARQRAEIVILNPV